LADIEQQQRPLFAASGCNARRIEKRAIVKTHHAHGNQAVFGVIAAIKSSAEINLSGARQFSIHPSRSSIGFHAVYCSGNSPFAVTISSPGFHVKPIRDCHRARARSAGQRNFFQLFLRSISQSRANAVGHFRKT